MDCDRLKVSNAMGNGGVLSILSMVVAGVLLGTFGDIKCCLGYCLW